jgi:protein-S-isoprenylcysteine O-methyltransferase Ste14
MAYVDEMRESGNWLFRWRSYLPLVFIAVIMASLTQSRFVGSSAFQDQLWEATCLAVSLFGLGIRCLTIGYTPAQTSGRNAREQRASQLNTSGIYSVVRHPLYLGNFFIWLGIAMVPHNWLVVLACACIFWLYYERIVVAEEAFIAGKFGDQFLSWADATPAFVPNPRLFRRSENAFSLRNVLKREYPAFSGIIFTLFLLEAFGDYQTLGRVDLDTFWKVLLTLAIGVHLVLRTLKKHTRLLHVPGR